MFTEICLHTRYVCIKYSFLSFLWLCCCGNSSGVYIDMCPMYLSDYSWAVILVQSVSTDLWCMWPCTKGQHSLVLSLPALLNSALLWHWISLPASLLVWTSTSLSYTLVKFTKLCRKIFVCVCVNFIWFASQFGVNWHPYSICQIVHLGIMCFYFICFLSKHIAG